MEKATGDLTKELSQAALDVLNVSHRLQKEFAKISEKSETAGYANVLCYCSIALHKRRKTSNATLWFKKNLERPHVVFLSLYPRRSIDPVKLVRRISVLERTIVEMRADCKKIAERRSEIAPSVIAAQEKNVALLQEVSPIL